MSAPQSGPGARHGEALDGSGLAGPGTASTSGDGPRSHLPRTRAGVVACSQPIGYRLTGADLYDWIALRRVSAGGIAKMNDHWFDGGLRVPGYVTDALTVLCDKELVVLAELDTCGMQRAALTVAGTVDYQRLCTQRETIRPLLESA